MFGIKPSKEKLMDKIEKKKKTIIKIDEKISNEFEAKNIRKLEKEKQILEEEISKMASLILKDGKLVKVEDNVQQQAQPTVTQAQPTVTQAQQQTSIPQEYYQNIEEQENNIPPQEFIQPPHVNSKLLEGETAVVTLLLVNSKVFDFEVPVQQYEELITQIKTSIDNNESIQIGNILFNTRNILLCKF